MALVMQFDNAILLDVGPADQQKYPGRVYGRMISDAGEMRVAIDNCDVEQMIALPRVPLQIIAEVEFKMYGRENTITLRGAQIKDQYRLLRKNGASE